LTSTLNGLAMPVMYHTGTNHYKPELANGETWPFLLSCIPAADCAKTLRIMYATVAKWARQRSPMPEPALSPN